MTQSATHLAVWAILSADRSEESSAVLVEALVVRLRVLRAVWAMALGRLVRAICLGVLGMLLAALLMALGVCWVVFLEGSEEGEVVVVVCLVEEMAAVVCSEEEMVVVVCSDLEEVVVVGRTREVDEMLIEM